MFDDIIRFGEYDFTYYYSGGVFNPRIGTFDIKELDTTSFTIWVVEDEYLYHGNGD